MEKRPNGDPDFEAADEFLKGDHPKRISKKEAISLGKGADLESNAWPAIEKRESASVRPGDLVALNDSAKKTLEQLEVEENVFEVTDVRVYKKRGVFFYTKNKKNPEKKIDMRSSYFRKIKE